MAKILKVSEFYTGEDCPNCDRNRLLTYDTDKGKKTVCEKCNWCVEDKEYFQEDEEEFIYPLDTWDKVLKEH